MFLLIYKNIAFLYNNFLCLALILFSVNPVLLLLLLLLTIPNIFAGKDKLKYTITDYSNRFIIITLTFHLYPSAVANLKPAIPSSHCTTGRVISSNIPALITLNGFHNIINIL